MLNYVCCNCLFSIHATDKHCVCVALKSPSAVKSAHAIFEEVTAQELLLKFGPVPQPPSHIIDMSKQFMMKEEGPSLAN